MSKLLRQRWGLSRPPDVPFTLNRAPSQATGLMAWWPTLASRGANVLRDLPLGANLSATGTPAWRAAPTRGQVVRFDDTNSDYFSGSRSAAANISGDLNFEVACWLRVNAWAENWQQPILCGTKTGVNDSSHGWYLGLYRSDTAQFARFSAFDGTDRKAGTLATSAFSIGQWYLAHGWRNSQTNQIHVALNGGASLHNAPCSNVTDAATMYVGSATVNANLDWDFSDVLLWDRRLTAAERWQLYDQATRWKLHKPLLRQWQVKAPAAPPPTAALPIFPPPDAIHSTVFGGVTVR